MLAVKSSREFIMHTPASSSHPTFAAVAIKAALFFGAGLVGIAVGGALWGFLGVAAVLFSVWIATASLDTLLHTQEIERLYNPSPSLMPTPAPVTQRVTPPPRVYRRPPAGKLESVRG